jgi:hypothetical protein
MIRHVVILAGCCVLAADAPGASLYDSVMPSLAGSGAAGASGPAGAVGTTGTTGMTGTAGPVGVPVAQPSEGVAVRGFVPDFSGLFEVSTRRKAPEPAMSPASVPFSSRSKPERVPAVEFQVVGDPILIGPGFPPGWTLKPLKGYRFKDGGARVVIGGVSHPLQVEGFLLVPEGPGYVIMGEDSLAVVRAVASEQQELAARLRVRVAALSASSQAWRAAEGGGAR